jgi:hypothetical protein
MNKIQKNEKYHHTVRTVPKCKIKVVERDKINTFNTNRLLDQCEKEIKNVDGAIK